MLIPVEGPYSLEHLPSYTARERARALEGSWHRQARELTDYMSSLGMLAAVHLESPRAQEKL